jgi:hypothetical protein
MRIHVALDGHGDSTVMTFTVTGLGSDQDWAGLVTFLDRTWNRVLDNLKSVLEANQQT